MGPLIGLAQALEAPQPAKGIGAALIRGQGYGFLAWIAVVGGGPRWSVELAREVTVGTPVPPVVVLCAAGLGLGLLYGLLFRRLDPNLTTAVGWGLSYGFLWWALGALTLLPVLEGEGTRWSAAEAAGVFTVLPALLLFGACVGLAFHLLQTRYRRPWPAVTPSSPASACWSRWS